MSESSEYPPSELMAAQAKLNDRERGKKQADEIRMLLDEWGRLYEGMVDKITRENTPDATLVELGFHHTVMIDSVKQFEKRTGYNLIGQGFRFDYLALERMTVPEFKALLDSTRESLVK